MAEHKHAAVLRAIADGVPAEEFEAKRTTWVGAIGSYESLLLWIGCAISIPDEWEIRRKPKYITINGFKVPKPLDVAPTNIVFVPAVGMKNMFDIYALPEDKEFATARGIAHTTKEAAIAHAKAMLGIDPEAQ